MSFDRTKMRLPRKPRTAISKGKPYGRHIGTPWVETIGDRVYGHAFHATKGKRCRRVYDASVRRRLIGI